VSKVTSKQNPPPTGGGFCTFSNNIGLWVKLIGDRLENTLYLATQQGQYSDNHNGDQNQNKRILN